MRPMEINAIVDGPADARKGMARVRLAMSEGWVLSESSERLIRDAIADADRIRAMLDEARRRAA